LFAELLFLPGTAVQIFFSLAGEAVIKPVDLPVNAADGSRGKRDTGRGIVLRSRNSHSQAPGKT